MMDRKAPKIEFQQKLHHVKRGFITEEELIVIEENTFSISML